MKLHERFFIVQKARIEFSSFMQKLEDTHTLTTAEVVQILADKISTHMKYAIRSERHPNSDKRGDEE